jgi:hypothetical protein
MTDVTLGRLGYTEILNPGLYPFTAASRRSESQCIKALWCRSRSLLEGIV